MAVSDAWLPRTGNSESRNDGEGEVVLNKKGRQVVLETNTVETNTDIHPGAMVGRKERVSRTCLRKPWHLSSHTTLQVKLVSKG